MSKLLLILLVSSVVNIAQADIKVKKEKFVKVSTDGKSVTTEHSKADSAVVKNAELTIKSEDWVKDNTKDSCYRFRCNRRCNYYDSIYWTQSHLTVYYQQPIYYYQPVYQYVPRVPIIYYYPTPYYHTWQYPCMYVSY